ncbi:L-glyceraldehyde 3-phosphate reductase [Pseudobythopirellula maris]|uniref:L-glyceraldehyde 3-phosphate reductase n=1 Tax=Pseudobythopirellula maris TaxID=2527991 RepID=A0A5C5ZLW5_9BACT|nr:aldo/keto reductase [Pseudobythopirellula maris]TWT88442.1 L-glyceraldehyde 3-phosphate reductase [Pseudobythopirellula maris]
MQYRRFGKTELKMPVFSCGGMRYQQSWTDMPLDEVEAANQANLEATIRRALELGVTHIETARGYGSSERQLGVLLPTLPRDELIVQTKIEPHADALVFRDQFEESLDRLGLEHVDLLGLHGVNNHEVYWHTIKPDGCLAMARRLQAEGKVRHVGFSTHASPDLVLDAVRTEAHGGFDYVNLHWYYIYQRNWPAVAAAAERDLGVFIISPADKGGRLYKPSERLVELCDPLHPLVMNCLFCLARPEVHTLSIGASCPSDFDLQMTALPMLDRAAELTGPIVERLDAAMRDAVGADVAERYLEGLPDWERTPGMMNLATILWLRGLALAYGMTEYGQMRYNLLGNGGHWFEGLNPSNCGDWDSEKLAKAVKDSPFADRIEGWILETNDLLGGAEVKRLSQS